MSALTPDNIARLKRALEIIADVQIELLGVETKSDAGEETWRDLYWIRTKLLAFIHCGFVPDRS